METEKYRGYTIEIEHSECHDSPRSWDNPGHMICFHPRYNLGDKHDFTVEGIKELVTKVAFSMPLFLYDHGGITMSCGPFSCHWDSGQVGYIYMTRGEADEELPGYTDEQVMEFLTGQVETYNQYIMGEVYGFQIPGIEDSCSGFYGSNHEDSGLLDHARNGIDSHISYENKRRFLRLKDLIRNNVPLFERSLILNNL